MSFLIKKYFKISLPILLMCGSFIGVCFPALSQSKRYFAEVEMLGGGIVPNYPNFPKTGISHGVSSSFGKTNVGDDHWVNYYNKPSYGFTLSYLESSNIRELGKEYGGTFFMDISPDLKKPQRWFFRVGIGATYFSKFYNADNNDRNKIIGSYWNWRFKAFLYRKIKSYENLELRLGAGYLHSSNGHTQIPNYGMNAAFLSLAARLYASNPYENEANFDRPKTYEKKETRHFIQSRFGLGMHEYGSTVEPVGGPKKGVYTASLTFAWLFNQQLKLKTGFTYRFYQHYYDEIIHNDSTQYNNPKSEASNVFWLLGIEYLIGNVALDIEGGINLYKPYFEEHYAQHIKQNGLKKFLKSTFPMRMGLNYYLFKPSKHKTFNAFVGASINANFGQADFTQLNIGISKRLKFGK